MERMVFESCEGTSASVWPKSGAKPVKQKVRVRRIRIIASKLREFEEMNRRGMFDLRNGKKLGMLGLSETARNVGRSKSCLRYNLDIVQLPGL